MKKLFSIIFLGLLLSGCAPTGYTSFTDFVNEMERPINKNGGHVEMHFFSASDKAAKVTAINQCNQYGSDNKIKNFKLVFKGSLMASSEYSYWHYDCENANEIKKVKDEIKLAKQKKLENIEKEKLALTFGPECEKNNLAKGTSGYNDCLNNRISTELEKQKALAKKLAAMSPTERHAYNCTEVFNFKKGTEKFNDCVFKLYTAELDLQKLELEKKVAEAQIKAAANSQAMAEAVANAQIASAKASRRSSDLNNSIKMMKMGSDMLSGSSSKSSSNSSSNDRLRTTCRNVGGFLVCN